MQRRAKGDGAVYRRPDGRWEGRLEVGRAAGRRVTRSIYGRSRREVQEKLRELQDRQRGGDSILEPTPRLADYLEHWIELSRTRVRPHTATSYAGLVRRHILPSLGQIRIDELRPQHVERLVAEKARSELSPRTVLMILQTLRMALNHAVRTGVITRNVAQMVQGPRLSSKSVDFLTTVEARALIEATRGHDLGPLITLCLTTGLRQGEALGLRWRSVDLELGHLTVTHSLTRAAGGGLVLGEPKTARSRRRLVLPSIALRALREQRVRQQARRAIAADYWEENGYVFTTSFGEPIDASNLRRDFAKLLGQSHIRPIRFHDLRHSAATLLLEQGVHPRIVMEMLGHSQIAVTLNTYSHVMPPLLGEAAKAMERALDIRD